MNAKPTGNLKPIPESKMSPEARVASQAHRRATKKKRAELRRRGLPMIIWKDGKFAKFPRDVWGAHAPRVLVSAARRNDLRSKFARETRELTRKNPGGL
jgi:hypothetical protein